MSDDEPIEDDTIYGTKDGSFVEVISQGGIKDVLGNPSDYHDMIEFTHATALLKLGMVEGSYAVGLLMNEHIFVSTPDALRLVLTKMLAELDGIEQ